MIKLLTVSHARARYNFTRYGKMHDRAFQHYNTVLKLYNRIHDSLNPREDTLIVVFLYLLVAEGVICSFLNYCSYLLTVADHDLFSLTKRAYVKDDLREVERVEMSTKIKFLNSHGFGVLTKEYDSVFRNDIAHSNYEVDEKGKMWIGGKNVDLKAKIKSLAMIMKDCGDIMNEISKKMEKRAQKKIEKLTARALAEHQRGRPSQRCTRHKTP